MPRSVRFHSFGTAERAKVLIVFHNTSHYVREPEKEEQRARQTPAFAAEIREKDQAPSRVLIVAHDYTRHRHRVDRRLGSSTKD